MAKVSKVLKGTVAGLALALALPVWAVRAAEPLASAYTNFEGVELDLMAVERRGSVLTVKWSLRNSAEAPARVQLVLTGDEASTYVVDEENGTKYFALTDKEGVPLASRTTWVGAYAIVEDVAPGSVKRYWAKFPAPPPEVSTVSVFFSDTEPIEDVAIKDR